MFALYTIISKTIFNQKKKKKSLSVSNTNWGFEFKKQIVYTAQVLNNPLTEDLVHPPELIFKETVLRNRAERNVQELLAKPLAMCIFFKVSAFI